MGAKCTQSDPTILEAACILFFSSHATRKEKGKHLSHCLIRHESTRTLMCLN